MASNVNRGLICLAALVLVVGAEFCSAVSSVYSDLNGLEIRYKLKQLFNVLGSSLERPHPVKVARILAATSDKDKPNTIANRYSINDLLAMYEVHKEDFTPEKFKAKLAMCGSLSPRHVEKPASSSVKSLMDNNSYKEGERNLSMDKEDRKPHVYMYHKNLHDYCIEAFENYRHTLRREMRVEDEPDAAVKQLETEVDTFRRTHLLDYCIVRPGEALSAYRIMRDFLQGKQADEVKRIRTTCSRLIERINFVAEWELNHNRDVPLRYNYVHTYCKGIFYERR